MESHRSHFWSYLVPSYGYLGPSWSQLEAQCRRSLKRGSWEPPNPHEKCNYMSPMSLAPRYLLLLCKMQGVMVPRIPTVNFLLSKLPFALLLLLLLLLILPIPTSCHFRLLPERRPSITRSRVLHLGLHLSHSCIAWREAWLS